MLIFGVMKLSEYLETHQVSQAAFGRRVSVTQAAVSRWIAGGRIEAGRVRQIAQATAGEVTPHDLRPDLFPPGFEFPPDTAQPKEQAA